MARRFSRRRRSRFGSSCGCGPKGFGRRRRRSFGAFTGGMPHSLLQMQGPYGASSYGKRRRRRRSKKSYGKKRRRKSRSFSRRRRRRSRFGAFTAGSPHSLLQMQGPYGASSYGKKRRRRRRSKSYGKKRRRKSRSFSRRRRRRSRFGAFTAGSPHSLLQMQGPYGASSYGKRRRRRKRSSHKKRKFSRRRRRRYSGMHHRFGMKMGPGFKGQTTYPNVSAPYFGAAEPWVNASGWWYPITGGKVQSPKMLMK